jgi:hypothetical protein
MIGAVITALRLTLVSAKVNSIENWLKRGSTSAGEREGKFARFFQLPFFGSCLAIWRWTQPIPDVHLRAGVRATTLIFVCGIVINLILIALYVVVVVAVIVIGFAIFCWILSLSGQGEPRVITRYTTDWFGTAEAGALRCIGQKGWGERCRH